jgi:hypothetical protein
MAKTVQVKQKMLLHASRATRVQHFEWSRFDQGIRLAIDARVRCVDDCCPDRIAVRKSTPGGITFLDPRSAEIDIELYEIKEIFLPIGAARHDLNPEKKGKS